MSDDQYFFYLVAAGFIITGLFFSNSRLQYQMRGFEKHNKMKDGFLETMLIYILCVISLASGGAFIVTAITFVPPPPNNLIILDIDGVLNHDKAYKGADDGHMYDSRCVYRLNKIIREGNAKLVVCSQWRIGQSIESMQAILNKIGVKGEVIGITPDLHGDFTRDDEITMWLQKSLPTGIHGIVYLDDDLTERFKSIHIKTSWKGGGLGQSHVARANYKLEAGLPLNFDKGKVNTCKSKITSAINFGGRLVQTIQSTFAKQR